MNNKIDTLELFYNKFNKLKLKFDISLSVASKEELYSHFESKITVKHLSCGYTEDVILKDWLSIQNRYSVDKNNDYIYFCSNCINEFKANDLQKYLNDEYNGEFVLISKYTGDRDKVILKHLECGAEFKKNPMQIKSIGRRLFCSSCKKSDSIYEKELQENKNKELTDRLNEKGITTYVPLEDVPGFTKKMKFKHTTCGLEFIGTPYDVYNNYHKKDHCPSCFKKNKTKPDTDKDIERKYKSNLKIKYKKFVKYLDYYTFHPAINSISDFEKNINNLFTITHKECGTTLSTTLLQWSKQRHFKQSNGNAPEFIYLCEYCSEKLNKDNMQSYIDETFNNEFKIVGKYKGAKENIDIMHINCGTIFQTIPSNLKKNGLTCKTCGRKDLRTEQRAQELKNKELEEILLKEDLSDFIPLEDNKGFTRAIKFKHTRCGSIIKVTPKSLINLKSKKYCGCCPERLLTHEKDMNKRTELAQKAFNIINNKRFNIVGLYDDNPHSVMLKHITCNGEFPISKRGIFLREIHCPHCESNDFKNNRFISINDKVTAFEDCLNNEYKILKAFLSQDDTIPIQHNACGHIFHRTVFSFLRSKDKLLCPKCRQEKKLSELNDKLQNKHNGEFEFCNINEYKSVRHVMDFIHTKCNTTFKSNFDKMMNCKTTPCPTCNSGVKNEQKFKSELYKKFKGEYLLLGEFKGNTKKTSFRHKKCNRLFSKSPYHVLTDDIACSHCAKQSTLLGMKKAQEKLNETSGGLFKFNGIFTGVKKEIPVTCNSCKSVFISTPKKMFTRKTCPVCKAKSIKKD